MSGLQLCYLFTVGSSSPMLNRDVVITAVVSLIIVFILSSILFFIIGCVCGWVGHKYKTCKKSDKTTHSRAAPLYEDLQPPTSMSGDWEKTAFELKENIAYGPVQSKVAKLKTRQYYYIHYRSMRKRSRSPNLNSPMHSDD